MPIPFNIAGLDQFVEEIPDGNIILIKGRIDPVKVYFAQHVGCTARSKGRKVKYITSRVKDEIKRQIDGFNSGENNFEILEERSARHWQDYIEENVVLIIDSFSYLMLDKSLYEFRDNLEDLRKICKEKNAIVLLTLEDNMLEEKQEITAEYLSDGIIHFLTKEISNGIARYLRFPKWTDQESYDQNIYYQFDGKEMKADPRARVR